MTIPYENRELLYEKVPMSLWHHEGIGHAQPTNDGRGFELACLGSEQGGRGCMLFLKPRLPDHVVFEYELTVHTTRGLLINYLGLKGINDQNPFDPASGLPPRDGIMANYWAAQWGLQSYHLSVSRYNDKGVHTGTANIRRNPGGYLVGHGHDPIQEIDRPFRLRIVKDLGSVQVNVDAMPVLAAVDHATNLGPIPTDGHFGFRLIGSDVRVTIRDFCVHKTQPASIWRPWVHKP